MSDPRRAHATCTCCHELTDHADLSADGACVHCVAEAAARQKARDDAADARVAATAARARLRDAGERADGAATRALYDALCARAS